jgi:hypothetical protein
MTGDIRALIIREDWGYSRTKLYDKSGVIRVLSNGKIGVIKEDY